MATEIVELDPRVKRLGTMLKVGGVTAIAVAGSFVVTIVAGNVIAASLTAVVAIASVQFLPIAVRQIELLKQRALTAQNEAFSAEVITKDEVDEGNRIVELEEQYKASQAELQGAQEELRALLKDADPDQQEVIQGQIQALQEVIDDGEATLRQRKEDYEELKKANRLLIAFHKSAKAMKKAQGAERSSQELKNLEESRNAVKKRMREALAGQKIAAMNQQIRNPQPNATQIAGVIASEKR